MGVLQLNDTPPSLDQDGHNAEVGRGYKRTGGYAPLKWIQCFSYSKEATGGEGSR